MVSNKSNKKVKKPVETTLGKAPTKPKEKEIDVSHLRKPIETSICGLKQVLSLLETATNEVKNFVMYECDILYECRTCRSIFRSLANFILHKRNYCREKVKPLDYINNNDTYQENICVSGEEAASSGDTSKSLNKVIEKLQKLEKVREVAKNVLVEDLTSDVNSKVKTMDELEEKSSNFNEIVLEKIDTNSSGVFQTLISKSSDSITADSNKDKSTKLEVMEIHKILESDVPVLDPEGKICGFTSNQLHQTYIFPKLEFNCVECTQRFSSQKSLTNHIKCVHNPSRIIYVCPTCKDTFANPWCVYRHLLKVHRMTNKQVRRMREQVHNSLIRRGEECSIQKKKPPEANQTEANSENQWINDIEGDNDFQMCAGCGKHFERKAALHSHSQMCAKRLEICNTIKENAKKKEVEAMEKAKLEKIASEKPLLTGASKRKGQSIWSYQRKPKDQLELEKETRNCLEGDHLNIPNVEAEEIRNSRVNLNQSPRKNDYSELLNSADNEVIQQKQDKLYLKIAESVEDKINTTNETQNKNESKHENSNTVDCNQINSFTEETPQVLQYSADTNINSKYTSIIKIEPREEDDKDINSEEKDENVDFESISRPPSNLSIKSSKSVFYPNPVTSPPKKQTRPRSDSFVNKSDAVSSTQFGESYWAETSRCCPFIKTEISASDAQLEKPFPTNDQENSLEASAKALISRELNSGIISEDLYSEENSKSHLSSKNTIVSSNTEGQEENSDILLRDDLLDNDVTFEMFCKKVAKVGRTDQNNVKTETNKRSRMLRKRRRFTGFVEQSSKSKGKLLKYPDCDDDDDDDVIFVGESVDKNTKFSDTSVILENGFAGFPNEETSQVPYSIDLSNLSYNNPLKCKQKDGPNDTLVDTLEVKRLSQKKRVKRKNEDHSADDKLVNSKHEKNEFNFILRATPYMNQVKLLCIPCGVEFSSFNLLLWHMSAHFSWFRFQCSKCSFITFNKYDCMLHARKEHKLKESSAGNCILPLPNWKTVLMSHEFRLLKDCDDLKGKHTDEKIGIDESQEPFTEVSDEIFESDAILFGEISRSSEEDAGTLIEKENLKKRNKSGKSTIDIQETTKDLQKLPEPVELAMPADISKVIRTVSFDESTLSSDETVTTIIDSYGDESNDDWGLPKESEYEDINKSNFVVSAKASDNKKSVKNEKANIRPSRIRTKAKQNADFVYYDNNVLKATEFLKTSPPKRAESVLPFKSKISGKSVPNTQKKKT